MAKTNAEKLLIKPGSALHLVGGEPEQRALLDPLPSDVRVVDGAEDTADADVAVLFAPDRAALRDHLTTRVPQLAGSRAVWIVYPKGNATDINRDSIWSLAEGIGWTANANVSVSETWSAVRIKATGSDSAG